MPLAPKTRIASFGSPFQWIMESILIFLVVILMSSSPALGISQSMSCSMVNGKTICEKQTSQGNSAASFGQAAVGGGQTFQDAYAGAGNPGQWDYGRQTVYGTGPGAGGASGYSSGFRSGPQEVSSGIYTSSSSSDYIPGQSGGFAGGFASAGSFPVGGGGFAFGGGYPGQGVATGGFATGGFFPFGGGYPAQPPAENSGAPNQGSGSSQGFNPFNFVFGQGGPGAFAGGFAGFPFGRR